MLAAALAALAVVAAGCGGGGSTGVASGATLGLSAAQLVPTDATAFVSVDSNLDSAQWQRVNDLTKSFSPKPLDTLNAELIEFAHCIAGKRPYPVVIDQVLHGMSVFDAVVRSGKSGKIETVE